MTGIRGRGQWLDIGIVVVLLGVGLVLTAGTEGSNDKTWVDSLLIPFAVAPVLLRRRWPLLACAALTAGIAISALPTLDQVRCGVVLPAAMLILFSLAARTDRDRAVIGLGIVFAGLAVLIPTDAVLNGGSPLNAVAVVYSVTAAAWAAGRVVRANELAAAELERRTEMLAQRREESAALAVEVERTLLAADLDGAVRVRVRQIIELAEAGSEQTGGDPEAVRADFGRIETGGREVLNQMRGLLGVLRSDERAPAAPRPTLEQLDALLEHARAGGRAVELEVSGERRPLPGGVELAAYRTLQHGLVAVGDAPATVALHYLPETLELEVRGRPGSGSEANLAVVAARERVTAQGGSFFSPSTAPDVRVLRASLPIAVADHA
jgi:signal transduction histidine kinase